MTLSTPAPQERQKRIAMWSGPRNISTAMMRAWENRADTVVSDEPFYAHYLAETGLDHPVRDAVLAAQPTDWRTVADQLSGPTPNNAPIWFQKHMSHHFLAHMNGDWLDRLDHAFLIRHPAEVLISYTKKREEVTLDDIGFRQQSELFDHIADRTGTAPPVLSAAGVLKDPKTSLTQLCRALGVPFDPAMLSWPVGRRDSDGVWAPHWYANVEASDGFKPYVKPTIDPVAVLEDCLRPTLDAALPYYEKLLKHCLA